MRKFSSQTSQKTLLLCPGQSSQHVGMLKQTHLNKNNNNNNKNKLQHMVETANRVLGYDVIDVCENGPITKLSRTVYCQPAVVMATVLAYEKWKQTR